MGFSGPVGERLSLLREAREGSQDSQCPWSQGRRGPPSCSFFFFFSRFLEAWLIYKELRICTVWWVWTSADTHDAVPTIRVRDLSNTSQSFLVCLLVFLICFAFIFLWQEHLNETHLLKFWSVQYILSTLGTALQGRALELTLCNWDFILIDQNSPFPPLPAPGNHCWILGFYKFDYSRYFI